MTILDYLTKAITHTYWKHRVNFYTEFNYNVIDNLMAYGHGGRVLSAGDMKRMLRKKTLKAYDKIVAGNVGLTEYADRWLNNVHGVAQFNKALNDSGEFYGGAFTVVKDEQLAKQYGYRSTEWLFVLDNYS